MSASILTILFLAVALWGQETTLIVPPFKHSWGIHKGTEKELRLFLGPDAKFSNTQALAVTRLDVWDDPSTEYDDDEVTVYGVNSGANEIIYNSSMYSLGVFRNEKNGGFSSPHGITALPNGLVYVADTGNKRVVKLLNDGKKLSFVSEIKNELFLAPFGVASDSKGNLYVSDTASGKIFIFAPDDKLVEIFSAKFVAPTAIAIVDQNEFWSYFQENLVAVVDSFRKRISLYNFLGEKLCETRLSEIGFDKGVLQYIAFDYFNNVYVTDIVHCAIHKFDHRLNYLTSFGCCGSGESQFDEPRGIAIYRKYGQVFIGERASAQYYWIGTDIKDVKIKITSSDIEISFILTEASYLTVRLERKGKHIPLRSKEKTLPGKVRLTVKPEFIKKGKWVLIIKAEPTYSSYGVFEKVVKKDFYVD